MIALTREHSLTNELAAAGHPLPPEFPTHVPTRSLGAGALACDYASVPARDGEWFLIASASVHRVLSDDAIAEALELSRPSAPDPDGLEISVCDLFDRLRLAIDDVSLAFAIVGAQQSDIDAAGELGPLDQSIVVEAVGRLLGREASGTAPLEHPPMLQSVAGHIPQTINQQIEVRLVREGRATLFDVVDLHRPG